jgi:hypothetical protein
MATGWDGTKGVLDGSVGWGSIDRSIPSPPSGVIQAAYFIKMGYNTFLANTENNIESITWPTGHYWGLLFGSTMPDENRLDDAEYDNFVGVNSGTTGATTNNAGVTTTDSDATKQGYGMPFAEVGTDDIARFAVAKDAGSYWAVSSNGRAATTNGGMVLTTPRDPSINGVLVINVIASATDNTVDMEVWLCPESVDFSAIDFSTLDLSNIASVFPNTNGWYISSEVNGSGDTGTNWRDGSGNFQVPDRFVARYPLGTQKMEIYNVAYTYGT